MPLKRSRYEEIAFRRAPHLLTIITFSSSISISDFVEDFVFHLPIDASQVIINMESSSAINAEEVELEKALRDKVQETYRLGNLEELTVKRIRSATEQELGLYEGYFKDKTWKDKSKRIIESEVVCTPNCTFCHFLMLM